MTSAERGPETVPSKGRRRPITRGEADKIRRRLAETQLELAALRERFKAEIAALTRTFKAEVRPIAKEVRRLERLLSPELPPAVRLAALRQVTSDEMARVPDSHQMARLQSLLAALDLGLDEDQLRELVRLTMAVTPGDDPQLDYRLVATNIELLTRDLLQEHPETPVETLALRVERLPGFKHLTDEVKTDSMARGMMPPPPEQEGLAHE